ncbi:unnamed protein product [Spirodela intermedia]|uniref:Uncharacterized protein n=1 Tax=Spirodela intermedia TaxID=51605 RepID=A0A7I8KEG5_SPIIN|nr:unnamed protein product [Spirodela intermedia]
MEGEKLLINYIYIKKEGRNIVQTSKIKGTCTPLPFHVTGGQPAVGQGVVVHDSRENLEIAHIVFV